MMRTSKKPKASKSTGNKSDANILELRLYVAGQTPKSLLALTNLKRICEEHLEGRYGLHVINLVKTPQIAQDDQILAIPTLVRNLPRPISKIIGDLSDVHRVLVGLNIRSKRD
jgi:circadian clock protein KaiB